MKPDAGVRNHAERAKPWQRNRRSFAPALPLTVLDPLQGRPTCLPDSLVPSLPAIDMPDDALPAHPAVGHHTLGREEYLQPCGRDRLQSEGPRHAPPEIPCRPRSNPDEVQHTTRQDGRTAGPYAALARAPPKVTISRVAIAPARPATISTNLGPIPFRWAAALSSQRGISTASPTSAKLLPTTQVPLHSVPLSIRLNTKPKPLI